MRLVFLFLKFPSSSLRVSLIHPSCSWLPWQAASSSMSFFPLVATVQLHGFSPLTQSYRNSVCVHSLSSLKNHKIFKATTKHETPCWTVLQSLLQGQTAQFGDFDDALSDNLEGFMGVGDDSWEDWEEWMGWEGAGTRDYSSHINNHNNWAVPYKLLIVTPVSNMQNSGPCTYFCYAFGCKQASALLQAFRIDIARRLIDDRIPWPRSLQLGPFFQTKCNCTWLQFLCGNPWFHHFYCNIWMWGHNFLPPHMQMLLGFRETELLVRKELLTIGTFKHCA
jgi:hypothetical protein